MKLKRQINSFLTILGLDRVVIDLEALKKELIPYDREYWAKVGTLTKAEKKLYAVADWCSKTSDRLANESGVVEHCIDAETQNTLEYICDRKDDNCIKLRLLHVMCCNYLAYLLHERLYMSAAIPLLIFEDFSACYYLPTATRPEPKKCPIPDFVNN